MPVATADKKGVMSATMAKKVLPLIVTGTTDTKTIIKINLSGKFNILCGCIGNHASARLFLISKSGVDAPPIIRNICGIALNFYVQIGDDYIVIYISGLSSWGEFSTLPFNGNVGSIEAIAEVPNDASQITPQ